MAFGRASSLDRQLKCVGGEILPAGEDTRPVSTRIAADWGTMVHGWKETGLIEVVNDRKNLPPLFENKLKESGVRREEWWPVDMKHEVAIAVRPFRQYEWKLDGTKAEKDAWKLSFDDEWVTGTVDGYAWMFDVLWVDDLKTGRFVSLEEYENQLRLYSLGIARVLDYHGPVNTTLTHWPRYPTVNKPERMGRMIEEDELYWFEKQLVSLRYRQRRARDNQDELKLTAGEHCTFCPAKTNCTEFNKEQESSN